MNNEKTLKVNLTRGELIDLLLLCWYHNEDADKWYKLHKKLFAQLRDYDEKHIDEEE